eukprot:Rhum_TRINITY_DN9975_c0_g1::Rhum_TRINITY_DN9975_c0_g1_i1::g.36198::m.36198
MSGSQRCDRPSESSHRGQRTEHRTLQQLVRREGHNSLVRQLRQAVSEAQDEQRDQGRQRAVHHTVRDKPDGHAQAAGGRSALEVIRLLHDGAHLPHRKDERKRQPRERPADVLAAVAEPLGGEDAVRGVPAHEGDGAEELRHHHKQHPRLEERREVLAPRGPTAQRLLVVLELAGRQRLVEADVCVHKVDGRHERRELRRNLEPAHGADEGAGGGAHHEGQTDEGAHVPEVLGAVLQRRLVRDVRLAHARLAEEAGHGAGEDKLVQGGGNRCEVQRDRRHEEGDENHGTASDVVAQAAEDEGARNRGKGVRREHHADVEARGSKGAACVALQQRKHEAHREEVQEHRPVDHLHAGSVLLGLLCRLRGILLLVSHLCVSVTMKYRYCSFY